MARELGVDLTLVLASGPKGRILKEDVQAYVNKTLTQEQPVATGTAIPTVPEIDFSIFGEVEEQPLTRIQKLTAAAMQRSWLNVPHVTHFDEADITDLDAFRVLNKDKAQQRELKLTPLPFLLKACAVALREHPQFNASLSASGETLIYKKYCHIGIAMDTPAGLMVPVIRDVDKKSIWELAEDVTALSIKGKQGKLGKADLEGGCFTISSLGAIGGTGFTPIVNTPEVAILGVSRSQVKPVYLEEAFVPRKMLPLTLSYDHRAVNGVDAGQFMTCLTRLLDDIRRLLM
jgi:pyruvate dehydrogenase E2 component (dihydrolipoamide acetyltransferase)